MATMLLLFTTFYCGNDAIPHEVLGKKHYDGNWDPTRVILIKHARKVPPYELDNSKALEKI